MSATDGGPDNDSPEVLWEDAQRIFCRLGSDDGEGHRHAFMPVASDARHSTQESIDRLVHEYELKDRIDAAWALRPTELVREPGRTMLVVDFAGGEPLDRLIRGPMEIGRFLRLAAAMSSALGRLHDRGLIHKDLKPGNVIVDLATERVWLTGFGIASPLPRERQSPEPAEFIAGTLAYMAPEQTGRVNRSIDSRTDLYSLGVTFYEMLTGGLPFKASEPMEWVHCHIARQPANPRERSTGIPGAVAAITMKMLSKTAEERYQSAAGVERDLRRCLSEWNARARIDDFPLGAHDVPDRLWIPEKLYGRRPEVEALLAAFDRVVAGGKPELVLVSGYAGIGKSSIVNELQRPLVAHRGGFASGKFDQYKRDIPYATLAQAFQMLIRPLLGRKEEDLEKYRDVLREALDPNGLLMVELVPELGHLIGEQPPVPELPPRDAQARFQRVIRRFIGVFARPEHPLALFLDDLQWLDTATLDLLEELLTHSDLTHLLLIGAYRDNEVSAAHPLMRKLDAIHQAGVPVQEIVLAPLGHDHLAQLLADCVRCEAERVIPLAQLIHEKTAGNPFFAIQFISTLTEEGLLAFDYGEGRWSWDLDLIRAKGYTDNVVELLIGKLNRLPTATQEALRQFACLGNSATFNLLQWVCQESVETLHEHLWEAVRAGLIFRSNDGYRFLHDRVQEAAYSLIPEELCAGTHLRLGMLLAEHTPTERLEEAIFEIVNQLNRGSHLITSVEEREKVARLDLIAGRRARAATAYVSALRYLGAGSELLSEETWTHDHALMFSIEYLMAECQLLTGDVATAEHRLNCLAERARSRHEHCVVTLLRIRLYTAVDRNDRGLDVFLDWLRREGTVWPQHPTREDAAREYERIWTRLGQRTIEDLVELPLTSDPDVLDTLDVFTEAVTTSNFFDEHLSSLIVCRMVNLSLEHGNCDASCFAYVWMAIVAGPRFGNYRDGFRFGQLGYDLVEKRGLLRYQARTYLCVGALVLPWTKHPASGRELMHRAYDAACRLGDLTFSGYCWNTSVTIGLAAGDPLSQTQKEAEDGLEFARKAGLGLVGAACSAHLGLIRTLRGLSPTFGRMDRDEGAELEIEQRLASTPNLALSEFYYWCRKLQARFFSGEVASAVEAARNAQRLLWTSTLNFESAEFQLYGGLARAAAWDGASPDLRKEHFEALTGHHEQLQAWAEVNPVTFENRAAIVGAEIARIEARTLDAEELYEKAARSARSQGLVHNEALANELAGRFYAARGFDRIAGTYLRDARNGYLRWGAEGKVRQLEQLHPQLSADMPTADLTGTLLASVERLDLATVMKVSVALSGEIVLEKLIDTLMRTAIEHAGAERGVLILQTEGEYRIEAEATTTGGTVEVHLRQTGVTAADLAESVVRYVLRTKESVLLHDASGENAFPADPYIREREARSVLCLPILKQSRLLGVLYLENNLAIGAFTPARMAVLKLLASEAAISMENARLYQDLAGRADAMREMQTELAHANRLATMGQLAASIAHEVNQPIGAARNNANAALRFLARDPPDLAEVTEALECVVRDTYRAGGIIGRIRDQVRKAPPRKESMELNDAIGNVIALVQGELSKHGVTPDVQFTVGLPPVLGDRIQLQQVVLNLVLNAIEAMAGVDPGERTLLIRTESSPSQSLLATFCDTGPGIAPEDRERVFESFYTTKSSGLGIGLAICRSIVDAHGGKLWVDAHPRRGAAFRFTLPALH